jgi:TMEM175 potassium channel family protein
MPSNDSENTIHTRIQFQVDRIAFFSDAVIAIAITLTVLEIKIPSLGDHITLREIVAKYATAFELHMLALFLCYFTIGNLWMRHHQLFEHIINYSKRLVRINLYFLLSVILLPISISFMFSQDNPVQLKLLLLFFNLGICNILYYIMTRMVYHEDHDFSAIKADVRTRKKSIDILVISIIYLLAALLVALNVNWYYIPFISLFFVRRIVNIFFKRKANEAALLQTKPVNINDTKK